METWSLRAKCEDDAHVNRRSIYSSGRDAIEVVPGTMNDLILFETEPVTTVDWEVDGVPNTAPVADLVAKHIPLYDPGFFELMRYTPKRHRVTASKDGRTETCEVKVYPDAAYHFDMETIRSLLRKDLWDVPLRIWKEAGNLVAEDFELRVLEKEDFKGGLTGEWREHPGPKGTKRDFRSYFGFFFFVDATPLAKCSVEMEISFSKLLNYLKRSKIGRKILDKLPDKIRSRLGSIKFEGSFSGDVGGTPDYRVEHPDKKIPSFGTGKPGASTFEVGGMLRWTGVGKADFDELIFGEDYDLLGSITVTVSLGLDAMMGFIFDVDDERFGAYLDAEFKGLDVKVEFELAGVIDEEFESKGYLAQDFDRFHVELKL
ncbi:MAG: hypothetical protein AAF799_22155 [Myxococcota bacterium]